MYLLSSSTALDTVDGNCTHGDLRIASHTDDSTDLFSEGRLEVCVNRVWGTICDTAYGTRDADVACSQLGYDDQGTCTYMYVVHRVQMSRDLRNSPGFFEIVPGPGRRYYRSRK